MILEYFGEAVHVAREVFLGQIKLQSLCAWSRRQLDPTQDGQFARVTDAIYLQLVVARKYRFLANVSVDDSRVVAGTVGPLLVTVLLYDEASEPAAHRTYVRMEIGYRGAPPRYALGTTEGPSPAGNWLARASDATGRAGAYTRHVLGNSAMECRVTSSVTMRF